jgi:hypothetical protein
MTNETRALIDAAASMAVWGGIPSVDVYSVQRANCVIRSTRSLRVAVNVAKSFRRDGQTIVVDTRNGNVVFCQR